MSNITFMNAIAAGDVDTMRKVLANEPDVLENPYAFAGPWLMVAAQREQAESARALLKMGADPNGPTDSTGTTAIAQAAAKANLELVTILHEGGAELDTSTMAANPLIGAIQSVVPQETRGKGLPVAQYLIDAGIDTTAIYTTNRPIPKINALQFAVEMGAQDIARAIGLHQTNGDEAATQALIDEASRMAEANTVPPENGADGAR